MVMIPQKDKKVSPTNEETFYTALRHQNSLPRLSEVSSFQDYDDDDLLDDEDDIVVSSANNKNSESSTQGDTMVLYPEQKIKKVVSWLDQQEDKLKDDDDDDDIIPEIPNMDESLDRIPDIYEDIPELSCSEDFPEIKPIKIEPLPVQNMIKPAKKQFNYRAKRKSMIQLEEIPVITTTEEVDEDDILILENKKNKREIHNAAESKLLITATAVALSAIIIMRHM